MMNSRWRINSLVVIFSWLLSIQTGVQSSLTANDAFEDSIKPFLKTYCIQCHGSETSEGELRLDTISNDFVNRPFAGHWIEVLDRINLGEMPPEDELQPSEAELAKTTEWITQQLQLAQHQRESTGGQVLLRRLTRHEYANTVRDLLGVEFVAGEGPIDLLPPDGSIRGFHRNSNALFVDPSLMNAYLEVAALISDQAIRFRPPLVPQRTVRFEYKDIIGSAMNYQIDDRSAYLDKETLVIMQGSARSYAKLRHPFNEREVPITGRYRVRIKASAVQGERSEPIYMRVKQGPDDNIAQFRVDATPESPQVYEFETVRDEMLQGEYEVSLVNDTKFQDYLGNRGERARAADQLLQQGEAEQATIEKTRLRAQGEDFNSMFRPDVLDLSKLPQLHLEWIEVTGPLQEAFPPESMKRLFPNGWISGKLNVSDARRIMQELLPKVYRRPVTENEVAEVVNLVETEMELGNSFEAALKTGLIATLCSPKFLYVFEPEAAAESERRLSTHELATRLSYFLWSSLPDETLRDLAADHSLRQPEILDAQVDRMLADSRIDGFMDGFVRQWLKIDEFNRFPPDQAIFPEYYATELSGIDSDILAQPIEMVREILNKKESLLALLDSDWTMLNERLAAFYGINGVSGEEFQRVSLPREFPDHSDTHIRGGLLGMAGIHRWGSDGSRTKPVDRGKYLLDVLYNDPPPPPPPNAGEIEPNLNGQKLTVRERLAKHREQTSCNNCHRRIDPYGLALENFNVIGQWRTLEDGEKPINQWGNDRPKIEIGATFPSGETYNDFASFKRTILQQDERFLRGLSEKLLMYALARTLEPSDRSLIDLAVANCRKDGDSMSAIIKTIVQSETFQRK